MKKDFFEDFFNDRRQVAPAFWRMVNQLFTLAAGCRADAAPAPPPGAAPAAPLH